MEVVNDVHLLSLGRSYAEAAVAFANEIMFENRRSDQ
jgi:hypothetical protein